MTTTAARLVMGTTASIIVHGGRQSADALFDRLDQLEAVWSRFRPGSELSRLNAAAGTLSVVSEPLYCLVEHLVSGRQLTGGRFDPTLHDQIIALGYDRTYRELSDERAEDAPNLSDAPISGEIELFPKASAVLLGVGVRLDPGGLGKGLAGDLVTRSAMESGADGVLVEIGGDVVTCGTAPDGQPWRIDIPATDSEPDRVIEMTDGAVATSDTRARTWTSGGTRRHHVLDPATGQPIPRDVIATVIAGAGWWAEALATAAIISTVRQDHWLDDDQADRLGAIVSVSEVRSSTQSNSESSSESNLTIGSQHLIEEVHA